MKVRARAWSLGILLLAGSATCIATAVRTASNTPILATPTQREKEALAIRLLAAAPMRDALAATKRLYADDELAKSASGQMSIDRAAEHLAMAAAQYAANEDASRSFIMWSCNAKHSWMGLDVPASGYSLDNPDNVYRMAPIDGASRYEIKGRLDGVGPTQQTFVVFRSIPGVTQTMNSEGHMAEIAGLQSATMTTADDGSYTITIDSLPANGRPNHMQVPADGANLHLLVRDSLADWNKERPVVLDIKRIDGPPLRPVPDEAMQAKRGGEILRLLGPYWLNWIKSHVYARPVNEVVAPWKRVTGWGFTQTGSFAIADDEAWVVTLDPLEARYFNFQLSDPWGVALEYVNRNGSLNLGQAKPNADGTYTFVAAAKDPGAYNWLDTSNLHAGTFQIRWQALPASGASADGAVREVRVVKLAALKAALPKETAWVTQAERRTQLADRAASYARRLK